jgi:hypothetical protein
MKKAFFVAIFILLFIPVAIADLGPKPSMMFNFEYKIPVVRIISGTQFECNDSLCTNSTPLGDYGPQGFRCNGDRCSSMAYGYKSNYHKLIIDFSDKRRESNIFSSSAFDAQFNVNVLEDSLLVTESLNSAKLHTIKLFFIALILTISLELITALIYFSLAKIAKRNLWAIVIVNLITLPIIWVSLFFIQDLGPIVSLILFPILYIFFSIVAIVAEGILIYIFTKHEVSIGHSFAVSAIMNLVSLIVGGIILLMISASIP